MTLKDFPRRVGPGWHALLDELHEQLSAVDPAYEVRDVKEKFGTLRVYLGGAYRPELHAPVFSAEQRSATICEHCGDPGELRTSRFWLKTLCDRCEGQPPTAPRLS